MIKTTHIIMINKQTDRILEDSIIYRGETDAFNLTRDGVVLKRDIVPRDRHGYFGMDPTEITINYGITAGVRVLSNLNLFRIYDIDNIIWLTTIADRETLSALKKTFPYDHTTVYRNSVHKLDLIVLNFICNNTEFDGYIHPTMQKQDGGYAHGEIAICKASLPKVQVIPTHIISAPDGKTYESMVTDMKDVKLKKIMEQSRESRKSSRLTDDDDDDFVPSSGRLLF